MLPGRNLRRVYSQPQRTSPCSWGPRGANSRVFICSFTHITLPNPAEPSQGGMQCQGTLYTLLDPDWYYLYNIESPEVPEGGFLICGPFQSPLSCVITVSLYTSGPEKRWSLSGKSSAGKLIITPAEAAFLPRLWSCRNSRQFGTSTCLTVILCSYRGLRVLQSYEALRSRV